MAIEWIDLNQSPVPHPEPAQPCRPRWGRVAAGLAVAAAVALGLSGVLSVTVVPGHPGRALAWLSDLGPTSAAISPPQHVVTYIETVQNNRSVPLRITTLTVELPNDPWSRVISVQAAPAGILGPGEPVQIRVQVHYTCDDDGHWPAIPQPVVTMRSDQHDVVRYTADGSFFAAVNPDPSSLC